MVVTESLQFVTLWFPRENKQTFLLVRLPNFATLNVVIEAVRVTFRPSTYANYEERSDTDFEFPATP